MAESSFAYVTYIRSSPEKIWRALQEPEFTRKYWAGTTQQSEWKKGSSWKLLTPDGRVADSGQVLEHDPHKKFAVTWRHDLDLETQKEGYSRMSCELEQQGSSVKVSIVHAMDSKDSKLIEGVSDGWPMILASLKSLLEPGSRSKRRARLSKGDRNKNRFGLDCYRHLLTFRSASALDLQAMQMPLATTQLTLRANSRHKR